MMWVTIISTQSLLHGISSASLAGNLSYFLFDCFIHWQMSHFLLPSGRLIQRRDSTNIGK